MRHDRLPNRSIALPGIACGLILAACAHRVDRQLEVADPSVPPPMASEGSAWEAAGELELPHVEPAELDGLHNVFELSDSIISGAEPTDVDSLQRIADMGVRTILSVDGKAPDAETAAELGLRYVHVPIQYKTITEDEMLSIAKTFRELEGPFYVHCFHGQHRGPAAAAIGRVILDGAPRDRAIAEMRQWCETAPKYEGLYAAIAFGEIPTAAETREHDFGFDPVQSFEGLRAAMVGLTRTWDNVKASQKRGWTVDPNHPDLDPAHEAVQLVELFDACAAVDESTEWEDDFRAFLQAGRSGSEELVRTLRGLAAADAGDADLEARRERAFEAVAQSCSGCHAQYRN